MGGGCELLCSGVSKAGSQPGLVCLLGEKSSGEAASVVFDFCDNMSRDVVAGLLFWGVMISKRSSNGSSK